jgi:hypothetical protein
MEGLHRKPAGVLQSTIDNCQETLYNHYTKPLLHFSTKANKEGHYPLGMFGAALLIQ